MVIVIKGGRFEVSINEESEDDGLKQKFNYDPKAYKLMLEADDTTFS